MKKVTIYKREILERTGYRKYPFKKVVQYIIYYNDEEIRNNHSEDPNNPKLKIPFVQIFSSGSKGDLIQFVKNLSMTNADKWLKMILKTIIEGRY